VGSVTGAMLLGKKKTVDDNCNADKLCTQEGTAAAESGRSLAPWTTVQENGSGASLGSLLCCRSKTCARPTVVVDGDIDLELDERH